MTATLRMRHDLGGSVTVAAGDIELFTYTYRPDTPALESPKPYLHPVRTLAGDVVTLFRPHDHVWHKGIAWSLPYVGEHNFWGGPTYVHGRSYVQLDNNGSAVHRELTDLSVDAERARVAHRLDWISQAGRPVIDEHRVLTVGMLDGEAWVLVFDTAMTNVSGSTLDFGSPTTKGRPNAGYGGLFWRGPRSFTGGIVQSPSGAGGDELRGTRAEWLGFRGQHDGTGRWSTIAMVDDPSNPRHPTSGGQAPGGGGAWRSRAGGETPGGGGAWRSRAGGATQWFTRSEGFACLCPAPFFSEEMPLPAGETIRFRYAVVVAAGDRGGDGSADLAAHGRSALAEAPALAPARATGGRVIG